MFSIKNFKVLSVNERIKLDLEELRKYYVEYRKYVYENNETLNKTKYKKKLYLLLKEIFSLKRKFIRQSLTIIKDERTITNRPIIYAINHNGKYDIEIMSEALKDHTFILMGDPEQLYRTIEGAFLSLNGVVYLEVDKEIDPKKIDSETSKKTMIRLLQNKFNIMWYPEGIWNLEPNTIILPFQFGIIEVALKSNALIVPVGLDQKDKDFYVSIGKYFDVNLYKNEYETEKDLKIAASNDLRDLMATELWGIWEYLGKTKRSDVPENFYDNFVNQRLKEWPEFTLEDIKNRIFNPPGITNPDDVFDQTQNKPYVIKLKS